MGAIEDDQRRYSGYVVSDREKCHKNRNVSLYRKRGRGRNIRRDRKVGSDRATPNGPGSQWKIDTGQRAQFYAYAKRTRSCTGAYSRIVSVVESDSAG
ncbi:MAG: hypothetical protein M3350_00515 [Actinomycetota bacterium]|nr:hypothetical protein [Actinomycetota bacterium]